MKYIFPEDFCSHGLLKYFFKDFYFINLYKDFILRISILGALISIVFIQGFSIQRGSLEGFLSIENLWRLHKTPLERIFFPYKSFGRSSIFRMQLNCRFVLKDFRAHMFRIWSFLGLPARLRSLPGLPIRFRDLRGLSIRLWSLPGPPARLLRSIARL